MLRVFGTTTVQLMELVDWLVAQRAESVAMESTSVYWIALYELLESRGIEAVLVNARQLHNVPGRKTDFSRLPVDPAFAQLRPVTRVLPARRCDRRDARRPSATVQSGGGSARVSSSGCRRH